MLPLAPVSTTASAVSSSGMRSAWSTTPIRRRSSRMSTLPRRWPSTRTAPALGWRLAPAIDSRVVLPAPLGPSSAQCSPGRSRPGCGGGCRGSPPVGWWAPGVPRRAPVLDAWARGPEASRMDGAPRRWYAELAWLGGARETVDERVLITTAGDRVVAVEPGRDPPPDARRLPGLVLPALANAHSHAFHRALRGRAQGGAGDFWSWRERMYALAARIEPDSYLELARATYAEMALAGIAAVGEFHYLHHPPGGGRYADPNAMALALLRAAAEAGVRITLLDTCYLQADADGTPLEGVQRRFGDGDAAG